MSRLSKSLFVFIMMAFLFACSFTPQPEVPTPEPSSTPSGIFNPQGTPLQEWRGIPIMPQATNGEEFIEVNTYSYEVNVTVKDVEDFYIDAMLKLGWTPIISSLNEKDGAVIVFQKDSAGLTITILSSDEEIVVMLNLS